jgi:hypothetical protein
MLRIIIEDIPNGRMVDAKLLGVVDIMDVTQTGLEDLSDYKVAIFEPDLPTVELTPESILASLTDTFPMLCCVNSGGWKEICQRAFDRMAQLQKEKSCS